MCMLPYFFHKLRATGNLAISTCYINVHQILGRFMKIAFSFQQFCGNFFIARVFQKLFDYLFLESCIIALQCILANSRICGLSYSEAQAMISQQYCRCHTASAKPKTQSAYAARGRYGVLGSMYYDGCYLLSIFDHLK